MLNLINQNAAQVESPISNLSRNQSPIDREVEKKLTSKQKEILNSKSLHMTLNKEVNIDKEGNDIVKRSKGPARLSKDSIGNIQSFEQVLMAN
jgi:hypothetical protein